MDHVVVTGIIEEKVEKSNLFNDFPPDVRLLRNSAVWVPSPRDFPMLGNFKYLKKYFSRHRNLHASNRLTIFRPRNLNFTSERSRCLNQIDVQFLEVLKLDYKSLKDVLELPLKLARLSVASKLKTLDIKIVDGECYLNGLYDCPSLESISLTGNFHLDVRELKRLKILKNLYVDSGTGTLENLAEIIELKRLKNIGLAESSFDNDFIHLAPRCSALTGLSFIDVNISLTGLESLLRSKYWESFSFESFKLESRVFSSAPTLKYISLCQSTLVDVDGLSGCVLLEELNLRRSWLLSDITGIYACTRLKQLNLSRSSVNEISGKPQWDCLEWIMLNDCEQLENISGLLHCKSLQLIGVTMDASHTAFQAPELDSAFQRIVLPKNPAKHRFRNRPVRDAYIKLGFRKKVKSHEPRFTNLDGGPFGYSNFE